MIIPDSVNILFKKYTVCHDNNMRNDKGDLLYGQIDHIEQLITLTCSTDVVCKNCPNNESGTCTTEEKVQRYDSEVLKTCGLNDGDKISYKRFLSLVKKHVIDSGKRKEICGDCSWDYICSKKS